MNNPKSTKDKSLSTGAAVAIGAGIGGAIGVALDNIPLGLGIGIAGSVCTAIILNRRTR